MLSNEEIQAMEILKSCGIKCNGIDIYKTLLNLIHRYSKEIEELKDIAETLRKENVSLYIERRQNENKIKAKIEEYDKTLYYAETEEGMAELKDYEYDEAKYGKKILQSLLEKE